MLFFHLFLFTTNRCNWINLIARQLHKVFNVHKFPLNVLNWLIWSHGWNKRVHFQPLDVSFRPFSHSNCSTSLAYKIHPILCVFVNRHPWHQFVTFLVYWGFLWPILVTRPLYFWAMFFGFLLIWWIFWNFCLNFIWNLRFAKIRCTKVSRIVWKWRILFFFCLL